MLEYFQGVLILTTNHIDHFDEAFASRFTISLAFDDLNEASRRTLWIRVRVWLSVLVVTALTNVHSS